MADKPKPFLARLKQHQTNMNRIQRDVRISPNRRLLAQVLAMWMDGDPDTRTALMDILRTQYGSNPKSIRWRDEEDPPGEGPTKVDREAGVALSEAMADLLRA